MCPRQCCVCGLNSNTSRDLCAVCEAMLPPLSDRCIQCGLLQNSERDSLKCEKCLDTPPFFDRCYGLFSYDPPATQLIQRFKFGRQQYCGQVLGELLRDSLQQEWYPDRKLPEAILPVPLYKKRLQERGFNQALELVRVVNRQLKLPLLNSECMRIRHTKAQSGLNAYARRRNLKTAFKLTKKIPYEHIAIMDDVVTTGTTVNTIAKLLKEAGVEQVDIWCICRA